MHQSFICVLTIAMFATGCTADWVIPEDYYVECETYADCPDSASCMLAENGLARVCVTDGRAECGNGGQEAGETCDDGRGNTASTYTLSRTCNKTCNAYSQFCGDGILNTDAGESTESNGHCACLGGHLTQPISGRA